MRISAMPRMWTARTSRFLRRSAPAIITGGAGDDPAGVLTYTTVGATTGISQLWLLLVSTPMLVATVSMAERIARHRRAGIVEVLRWRFGPRLALGIVILLLASNLTTFAADVAAVAEVAQILTGIPWEVFVPMVLFVLWAIFRSGYVRVKTVLTALALVLLVYVLAAWRASPDWRAVFWATIHPHVRWERTWLVAALGLLGTTISPYMLFWQSNAEVEENHSAGSDQPPHGVQLGSIWLGMIFSNVVSLFIVVAAATALHGKGGDIETVYAASQALAPLGAVGELAFVVGVIGAGLLALPVFAATSAYAIAELFQWSGNLDAAASEARGFYLVLSATVIIGAIISLLPEFDPPDALFYSQVFNGILLPLITLLLLYLANDRQVVGEDRSPSWVNVMAIATILLSCTALLATILT